MDKKNGNARMRHSRSERFPAGPAGAAHAQENPERDEQPESAPAGILLPEEEDDRR